MPTLDTVTITGADNSTDPRWMADVSKRYPFVEWGILLSSSLERTPRFPSMRWIEKLRSFEGLQLSGHLCGKWVRQLMWGRNTFTRDRPSIASMFSRAQLNYHAEAVEMNFDDAATALKRWSPLQYIVQMDGVNDGVFAELAKRGVPVAPLFDTSGGAGIEPATWPAPLGNYSGYAGGLHPLHLDKQYEAIATAAGDARIWIDVETHVRTPDNAALDTDRVEMFLAKAEKYVTVSP